MISNPSTASCPGVSFSCANRKVSRATNATSFFAFGSVMDLDLPHVQTCHGVTTTAVWLLLYKNIHVVCFFWSDSCLHGPTNMTSNPTTVSFFFQTKRLFDCCLAIQQMQKMLDACPEEVFILPVPITPILQLTPAWWATPQLFLFSSGPGPLSQFNCH